MVYHNMRAIHLHTSLSKLGPPGPSGMGRRLVGLRYHGSCFSRHHSSSSLYFRQGELQHHTSHINQVHFKHSTVRRVQKPEFSQGRRRSQLLPRPFLLTLPFFLLHLQSSPLKSIYHCPHILISSQSHHFSSHIVWDTVRTFGGAAGFGFSGCTTAALVGISYIPGTKRAYTA